MSTSNLVEASSIKAKMFIFKTSTIFLKKARNIKNRTQEGEKGKMIIGEGSQLCKN